MPPTSPIVAELAHTLAHASLGVFVRLLCRRLQHLGVGLVDGRVVDKAEAARLAGEVMTCVRGALDQLADRPGDALRVLDAVRSCGFVELEDARDPHHAACVARYPAPPPATWRELDELHERAVRYPAHCQLGPPAPHVEFVTRLAADGTALPGELLALYAACSHVRLACRHVDASAGDILSGDALRVRDGRIILIARVPRRPATLLVDQPALSIELRSHPGARPTGGMPRPASAQALGTWWLVLEDERAPARCPLDLQGLLRFALRRAEAPSLEALLTDLAWRQLFV